MHPGIQILEVDGEIYTDFMVTMRTLSEPLIAIILRIIRIFVVLILLITQVFLIELQHGMILQLN
jgi:hypothetical protein